MTLDEWRADVQSRGGMVTWAKTVTGRDVRVGVWPATSTTPRRYEYAPLNVQAADVYKLGMEALQVAAGSIVTTRDQALAPIIAAGSAAVGGITRILVLVAIIAALYIVITNRPR